MEITEHELVDDYARMTTALDALRDRGARVAVDDAGAGYAGLERVMRLEPDVIKLDRALISGIDRDLGRAALVEAFVRFARRTGATVCAEGIETLDELTALAQLDVPLGQGWAIARPSAPWAGVATEATRICDDVLRDALAGIRDPRAVAARRGAVRAHQRRPLGRHDARRGGRARRAAGRGPARRRRRDLARRR